jgi:phosphate-selective porin OprO/OprP
VRSTQHVVLYGTHDRVAADAWQVVGQWVITGDDATYNSITPRHPFDPAKGHIGAFDVVGRIEELRVDDDGLVFAQFADAAKSVLRARSGGIGVDWFANKAFRAVVDLERTYFTLGAKTGDRAPETSIEARVQLAF